MLVGSYLDQHPGSAHCSQGCGGSLGKAVERFGQPKVDRIHPAVLPIGVGGCQSLSATTATPNSGRC